MKNLQKIIVFSLFVVLVGVVIFYGIQKSKEMKASKGPGPQVPAEQVESPSLEIGTGVEGGTGDTTDPLQGSDDSVVSPGREEEEGVECTADAQICPDGSAVGRSGPDCTFAECPTQTITVTKRCSTEQKKADACTMQYEPVCGLVEVQCVTTPCNPVPETFGNACSACAQGNVVSYSSGACEV